MALASLAKDCMMNMRSKEEPSISHLQLSSDEVSYKQIPQSSSIGSEVSDGDALEKNSGLCRKETDANEMPICSTTNELYKL